MSEEKSVLGQATDTDPRRAAKDRRLADQPYNGEDRRKGAGGFVIELHKDENGKPKAVVKRKKQLDRRKPANIFDHQR